MRRFLQIVLGLGLIAGRVMAASGETYVASTLKPPPPAREFRGMWVATVGNINWPSKPGLTTQQQKAELLALLDCAKQLRMNAVIFQVRPACDALYVSRLEPWSEYLTGRMGQAPRPLYDPLALAVEEAHRRGLELHAWFNPFRARYSQALSVIATEHVSRTRPQLVKRYGKFLWLDPGEKAVHDYSVQVILDVVRRYDIDGVHMDDYFYPYPEISAPGKALDFPDDPSWSRYAGSGGRLSREDWRRDNVNRFVQRLYQEIKAEKPWVKFGVSPFGIWRPGVPAPIRGFDAYAKLYADSRLWLAEGWLDYFTPQLYWSINAPEQSFPVLLRWWADQNGKGRHLWSGISVAGVDGRRTASEVLNQVRLTRQQSGATGHIFWSAKPLLLNRNGVADSLGRDVYAQPALVPASPWLDDALPPTPKLKAARTFRSTGWKLTWAAETSPEKVWLWVLQTKNGGQWRNEVLPGNTKSYVLSQRAGPEAIALTAVGRCGKAGAPAVMEKQEETARAQ